MATLGATVGVGPFSASREVSGWGLGDIVPRAQLGWQAGDLSYSVWRLRPLDGTSRPFHQASASIVPASIRVWPPPGPTRLRNFSSTERQVLRFNFENEATDYQTGTEFHFEWAIGYEFSKGFIVGVVGYDYRQLSGDSGPGAVVGPCRVDAVGPGFSYTTMLGTMPLVLNLSHYREFNAEHRFEGNQTLASVTLRF